MFVENFTNKYNRLTSVFEKILDNYLAFKPEIHQAATYSLLSGGKRLRPVLTLAVTEMLQLELDALGPFALAVELIHTSSLIHDDLPALDNDNFRRGKPTCHKVYGEAIALLSGDALISEAFRVISADQKLSAVARITLVELLSKTATTLCQGQILDLPAAAPASAFTSVFTSAPANQEAKSGPSFSLVQAQHLKKTAALITAACLGPALTVEESSGETKQTCQALHAFGQDLGLLFQLTDDLLDAQLFEANDEKQVVHALRPDRLSNVLQSNHKDAEQSSQNYVRHLGEAAVRGIALDTYHRAISSIGVLGEPGQFLADLAKHVLDRES